MRFSNEKPNTFSRCPPPSGNWQLPPAGREGDWEGGTGGRRERKKRRGWGEGEKKERIQKQNKNKTKPNNNNRSEHPASRKHLGREVVIAMEDYLVAVKAQVFTWFRLLSLPVLENFKTSNF